MPYALLIRIMFRLEVPMHYIWYCLMPDNVKWNRMLNVRTKTFEARNIFDEWTVKWEIAKNVVNKCNNVRTRRRRCNAAARSFHFILFWCLCLIKAFPYFVVFPHSRQKCYWARFLEPYSMLELWLSPCASTTYNVNNLRLSWESRTCTKTTWTQRSSTNGGTYSQYHMCTEWKKPKSQNKFLRGNLFFSLLILQYQLCFRSWKCLVTDVCKSALLLRNPYDSLFYQFMKCRLYIVELSVSFLPVRTRYL